MDLSSFELLTLPVSDSLSLSLSAYGWRHAIGKLFFFLKNGFSETKGFWGLKQTTVTNKRKEKREEILKYQLLIYAKVEDERERDQETSLKKREMKKKDVPWRLTGSCMHGVWLKWVRERERSENKSKMSAYFWVLV